MSFMKNAWDGFFGIEQVTWQQQMAAMQKEAADRALQQAAREFHRQQDIYRAKMEGTPDKWGEFEDAEIIEDVKVLEHK